MADPLLPTRTVPSFASDPQYLRMLKERKAREMAAARMPQEQFDRLPAHLRNPPAPPVMQAQDPSFRPAPSQMPGSALPQRVADPSYRPPATPPMATPLQAPIPEGPRLDGMPAGALFQGYADPTGLEAVSGPPMQRIHSEPQLMDNQIAAELL